jgi:hypothetical protein
MTTFTTEDRESEQNWYQSQYYLMLDEYKKLEEECKALREQLNELQ